MKNHYNSKRLQQAILVVILLVIGVFAGTQPVYADIWEPEGLNMPGGWNGWTNPPTNNLALASYTQVVGGRVTKISTGTPRWQTTLSVAASGGDIVGGSYEWLFTSSPSSSPWNNKWNNVNVVMNTVQTYTFNGGPNNNITVTDGKWYTMNWKDSGYGGTQAIFMETSALPVDILSVTGPSQGMVNVPQTVDVTLSTGKSAEEIIYLRYSTDGWLTSSVIPFIMTGANGTVQVPGQADGVTVSYYVFSSTVSVISGNYDLVTIKMNNNAGTNYSYIVGAAPISWANILSPATGTINPGGTLDVYASVLVVGSTGQPTPATGIQGWIGYSSSNTSPSTWTDWVVADYSAPDGNNDVYKGTIGAGLSPGTYYYASRFQLGVGPYQYGGYNGGYWNGTSNISGILTVNGAAPTVTTVAVSSITGYTANVDGNVIADGGSPVLARGICWSTSPNPTLGDSFTSDGTGTGLFTGALTLLDPGTVYHARAYATNSNGTNYGNDLQFTTLYSATFLLDMSTCNGFIPGTDSVYVAGGFPGATWNEPGTNPALKFTQLAGTNYALTLILPAGSFDYKYFRNATWGGGEWGSTANRSVTISANVTISNTWGGEIIWANLQWPDNGVVDAGSPFDIYSQMFVPNFITGSTGGAYGMQGWIGYSSEDTDPSTWTNWVPSTYSAAAGGNDEFKTDLGSAITIPGTYYYASRFQFGTGSYVYGGFNSGYWDGITNLSGVLTVNTPPPTKALSLKVFLEGLYNGAGGMNKAQGSSGDEYPGTTADKVTIELHDSGDGALVYSLSNVDLSTSGIVSGTVPIAHSGNYYIYIIHRNSVTTSSANPISFAGSVISYDFTTGVLDAFGSNMKDVGGVAAIFAGDVDQSAGIDASDMIAVDNDNAAFATGYLATDVDGSGGIDASDLIIVDNNNAAFIGAVLPF